jgi:hypothetical protein
MDPLAIIIDIEGFVTRAQALELGLDDAFLTSAVRRRVLHRIRRGYYTLHASWTELDDVGRHLLRTRCVLHSLGPTAAASHVSGALLHGLTVWSADLTRVHVTRLDAGASRIEPDLVHHRGKVEDADVTQVDGLRVLAADRCALETGSILTPEGALVVLDSFLHLGLGDPDDLFARFTTMEHWPGTLRLHVPIRMADGRAASAGESRGRWLMRRAGLPAPLLQYEVRDHDGALVGISDWAWPEARLLGEFDGQVKYGRLLLPGQEPGDAVFAEKLREDRLRELTGFSVVRLVWSDLDRPLLTARRIRQMLDRPA